MKVSFRKKALLPNGEHRVTITDITEVKTSCGERAAIKLTPDNDDEHYQDLNIWISEKEDSDGICGKILSLISGDDEGDYYSDELIDLLRGRHLIVKTKQNTKDGKTYVNIVDVIDVEEEEEYEEEEYEEEEYEEEEYEEEEDEEEEEVPNCSFRRKRKPSSSYRK